MLSSIQISVPERLADRLKNMQDQIPHIIELGLRRLNAEAHYAFEGADDIFEFLASLPEPEDILKLRPSKYFQARISSLLEKKRDKGLSLQEEKEWEHYQYIEHIVRMAKIKASIRLKKTAAIKA